MASNEFPAIQQRYPPPAGFPAATLDAYLTTRYRVDLPRLAVGLTVGEPSSAIVACMLEQRFSAAVLITAYNPYSRPTSAEENARRQAALMDELRHRELACWHGYTEAPGDWPVEPLAMVIGLGVDAGIELARQFEQNAIVSLDLTGVPQLAFAV